MDFFDIALSDLEPLIRNALAEDFAHEDITTAACLSEQLWARGELLLKQSGCIAGLKFIPWIFHMHDPRIHVHLLARDGEWREKGTPLAQVEGPAREILGCERVALNFLQHLSGVATLTALCVEKTRGTKCKVLDTRKTILGLRSLQKYAVRMGGGTNHRLHLADRILIKSNHLSLAARDEGSPLFFCIQRAKALYPDLRIEAEVGCVDDVETAIEAMADAILLDNMTPEEVREAVAVNRNRAFLEASGGIGLETLAAFANTGIDAVSIGALTHSAPALDISLRLK